ncbi:MAG: 2-hydroxyacyl-CoA dehydratase [Candidatus Hydrothermarchaeales archaeon]
MGALLVKTDVDTIFAVHLDPDNPLESMARKMVAHYYNSIIENRIEAIKKMVKDYFIDGVIIFPNFGCRIDCGGQRALQDVLYQQMGIPSLILEGDFFGRPQLSIR